MPSARAASIASVVAGLVVVLGLVTGCEGRFPVCKTNADCSDKDAGFAGHVCYNLKCVECHYDTDCKPGETCGAQTNECEGIGVTAETPRDAGPGEPTAWEHGTWDQCAADCKDRECIKVCDAKFNK